MSKLSPRTTALLAVVFFGLLVWLYVRAFAVFSRTMSPRWLVLGSMLVGAALAGGVVWRWRARFMPWERHFPEVILLSVFCVLFAPLFGSLFNRGLGKNDFQSFEFVSETAYFASGYGILKGEKLKPTGWRLAVRENGRLHRFSYKTQAAYPLTKTGETVLIPVRRGLFGITVLELPFSHG